MTQGTVESEAHFRSMCRAMYRRRPDFWNEDEGESGMEAQAVEWLRTALTQAREEGARAERAKVVEWAKKILGEEPIIPTDGYTKALVDLIAHLSDK